jgi:predicted RNase H-like nuclease (RuvC/YqgF family)
MSASVSEVKSLEKSIPKMTNEYLCEVVDELNANCLSHAKSKEDSDIIPEEWNDFRHDISFNYSVCRDYCMKIDQNYCNQYSYKLCESCSNILEERIRKPFNKTQKELQAEQIQLEQGLSNSADTEKKVDLLITCIYKLTNRITMLEEKVSSLKKEIIEIRKPRTQTFTLHF